MAVVAAVGLLAAACGDRGDDESGGSTPPEESSENGGETTAAGDFGELTGVCGPNESGGAVADDADEAQGVDDESIKIGTVADPGFEGRPGLNQEIFDAAEAFVAWCNEAGGINGKQLELTLYDAAITEYQPQIEAACENEFALVGSGAVQDSLWPVGIECGLVDIAGFSVTPEKAGVAGDDPMETRAVQPLPNPADRQIVTGAALLSEEFPDAPANSGILNADLQTLITQKEKEVAAFEQTGSEFVHEATYNVLGEANWAPFAAAIEEAGVTWLRFVGEGENFAQLQQALLEIGYEPDVTFQAPNFYDQNYLDAAGDGAEGTFVEVAFWPFEEAADNPATQQYLDLMEEQGGKVALLGAQAISGWLLFATAAAECDAADDLTRTCLLETAGSVTEWTGGGLHAPTNPADNTGASCGILLQVQDGEFVRHAPTDDDYACSDDFLVEVPAGSSG